VSTLNEDERRCYIGTWPACGCIRFVSADDPDYEADNAKEVARLIRMGYRVENITVAEFKSGTRNFGCDHQDACLNPHNRKAKQVELFK
jgi:hypothetical protein